MCMYMHMYLYRYLRMYAHTYTDACLQTDTYMRIACAYTYVCTSTCTHILLVVCKTKAYVSSSKVSWCTCDRILKSDMVKRPDRLPLKPLSCSSSVLIVNVDCLE